MNITPFRLRTIGLAALSAALIVLLLAGHGKPPRPADKSAVVTTVGRSLPPADVATPKNRTAKRPDVTLLRRQAANFLRSYYRLVPADTPMARRGRIAPFVSKRLLESLDLTPSKSRATVQASVDASQMDIRLNAGSASVSVTVRLYIQRAYSGAEKYISLPTHSRWRWRSGSWVLSGFN